MDRRVIEQYHVAAELLTLEPGAANHADDGPRCVSQVEAKTVRWMAEAAVWSVQQRPSGPVGEVIRRPIGPEQAQEHIDHVGPLRGERLELRGDRLEL